MLVVSEMDTSGKLRVAVENGDRAGDRYDRRHSQRRRHIAHRHVHNDVDWRCCRADVGFR